MNEWKKNSRAKDARKFKIQDQINKRHEHGYWIRMERDQYTQKNKIRKYIHLEKFKFVNGGEGESLVARMRS